ncbi:MAG: GntR family transcriptional regulator [Clostridiales bacterium]|nr:GntR family transcriptional regulator [Clostridiales bacterium]
MEALESKQTSEYIAEQLAEQILTGEIPGGSPLRQEELATQLGISRIPVREALQILQSQGLIQRLSTRRMISAEVTPEKLRQTFAVIARMELAGLQSIAQAGKLPAFQEAVSRSGSEELSLHLLLARETPNEYLQVLLSNACAYYLGCALRHTTSSGETYRRLLLADAPKETEWLAHFSTLAEALIAGREENR